MIYGRDLGQMKANQNLFRAYCAQFQATRAKVRPKAIAPVQKADNSSQKMNTSQSLSAFAFLLIATTLEVTGDAVVRLAIYNYAGVVRLPLFLGGAILLFGYGTSLNLAPVEFRHVVGLYVATLFVVWQLINVILFRTLPNLPIFVGGTLIVVGGLMVTFWKPN